MRVGLPKVAMMPDVSLDLARQNAHLLGKKAVGLSFLMALQTTLQHAPTLSFLVPFGFVQTVGTHLDRDRGRIGEAFDQLTKGIDCPTVIFARDSAVDGTPGICETHSALFDPADPYASFERYLAACHNVLRSGGQMAILGQIMVGKPEEIEGSSHFGYSNVSFYADCPSPQDLDQVLICAVAGLGSLIAEYNEQSTVLFCDWNGEIKKLLSSHNQGVDGPSLNYRQKVIELYSLASQEFHRLHDVPFSFLHHVISRPGPYSEFPFLKVPFNRRGQVEWIVEIANRISDGGRRPGEIEGAFSGDRRYLFQVRDMALPKSSATELSELPLGTPAIHSDNIFGCFQGELPLVVLRLVEEEFAPNNGCQGSRWISDELLNVVKSAIDRLGQVALFSDYLSGEACLRLGKEAVPVFVTSKTGNPTSHLVGRVMECAARGAQVLLMQEVSLCNGFDLKEGSCLVETPEGSVYLFDKVRIETGRRQARIIL